MGGTFLYPSNVMNTSINSSTLCFVMCEYGVDGRRLKEPLPPRTGTRKRQTASRVFASSKRPVLIFAYPVVWGDPRGGW